MTKTVRKQKIDTIFVLIIFCTFAVSILMVLTYGARIYKNLTEISRKGSEERTILSYIWTKVKNNDNAASIYVDDFYGIPALCFDEEFGGIFYKTAVYHYDGWVFELFCEKDLDLPPDAGMRIISIPELTFEELENGLIKISAGARTLLVFPRGTEEPNGEVVPA